MNETPSIKDLVAEALTVLDVGGAAGLEALLARHPTAAEEIRSRLEGLRSMGLISMPTNSPPARAPKASESRLGRYRLLRVLGTGGMSIVHLARDETLDRLVALKMLPRALRLSERARERFRREALAVARLDHPNIVPVFEVDEAEGVPFFSMRFVRGRTLGEILESVRGRNVEPAALTSADLSALLQDEDSVEASESNDRPLGDAEVAWGRTFVETACRFVIDVANALQHAHEQGVVHRDVKPSNILVTPEGRAHLFDFGIARLDTEEALTLTGDFAGTPYYVSPEQIAAQRGTIDARTDVYSLGVTLFELLTLRVPFEGRDTNQVLRQIATKEPPLPRRWLPSLPRDLERICLTALEKDPARRYQSAAEMAADVERFLEFRPVSARPIGGLRRFARTCRRRPATLAAALLAVVILVGAPTMWIRSSLRERAGSLEAAQRTASLLERIIFDADIEEHGPETPVVDLLREADARIRDELRDQPVVQARLLQRLGSFFAEGGEIPKGCALLEEALAIQVDVLGESHPDTAETLNHLANQMRGLGRNQESEAFYRRSLAARLAARPVDPEEVEVVRANLAGLLTGLGRLQEAEHLLEQVYESLRSRPDVAWSSLTRNLCGRAWLLNRRGEHASAEELCLEALALVRKAGVESERRASDVYGTYGRTLLDLGRASEAEDHFRLQLGILTEIYSKDHWVVAEVTGFVGESLLAQEHYVEATAAFETALEAMRTTFDEANPKVVYLDGFLDLARQGGSQ